MTVIVRWIAFLIYLSSSQLSVATEVKETSDIIKAINETTLKVPRTWTIDESKGYVEIKPPEQDVTIRLLDLPTSKKAEDTIGLAWKKVNPSFHLKVHSASSPPPNDGWDELYQINYEVPESESRTVGALAKILNDHSYVILYEGTRAGFDRRGAQVGQIFSSWKANHLFEETLNERKPLQWLEKEKAQFESFIRNSMKSLQVPGASIAVIQDNRLTYKQGFGVKKLGLQDLVTTDTPFMIGSITKSLTTLLMAKVIEEHLLKWTTPVKSLLESFQLSDTEMTKKLDLQHTVCACTGMPRRDFELILNPDRFTPESGIESLKTMKPTTGFGETFQYSNQLVALGGYATARAIQPTGSLELAFSNAMKTHIFDPLEMNRSTLNPQVAASMGAASPHSLDFNNRIQAIGETFDNAVYAFAPAGAVWSSVEDLAKYAILELNLGILPSGKRLLSESSVLARREAKIKMGNDSFYGLGITVSKERGLNLIGHNGGTAGFSSLLLVIPEKKVGLVILTNANASAAGAFIAAAKARFMEITFGANPKAEKKVAFELQQREEELKRRKDAVFLEGENLNWIKTITGRYSNPLLGQAKLALSKTGYEMEIGGRKCQVGVKIEKNGEKSIAFVSPPWNGINFLVKKDGDLLLDGGQFKYVFKREITSK